jgi:hypothetical protein
LALAAILASSGCRTASPWTVTDDGRPRYRSAEIVYELSGPNCTLPLDPRGIQDDDVAVVEYTDDAFNTTVPVTWSAARLRIVYPHPKAGPEYARAELALSRDPLPEREKPNSLVARIGQAARDSYRRVLRGPSGEFEHRIVVDVPRSELDHLLTDLEADGFFEQQTRPLGGATLSAHVGWSKHSKNWTAEPLLDHLMTQIYQGSGETGLATAGHAVVPASQARTE